MIGHIEDKQIFGRWLRRHWVPAADGELKVEIRVAETQHGSIEAIVVRKVGEFFKAQALLVLGDSAAKIQHGARDSQMNAHNWGGWWARPHYSHRNKKTHVEGPCFSPGIWLDGNATPTANCHSPFLLQGFGSARSSRHAFNGFAVADAMRSTRPSPRSTTTFMHAHP